MVKQAKVYFSNSKYVKENEQLNQFISSRSNEHSIVFSDGELLAIINANESKELTLDKVRMIAGSLSRDLGKQKVEAAELYEEDLTEGFPALTRDSVITAFVEGWVLGTYQFTAYKSKVEHVQTALQLEEKNDIKSSIELGLHRAYAVVFARDLMNEAPNMLNPTTFPDRLKAAFSDTDVDVTILDKEKIEEQEMNGLLAVNRGSEHDPAFVELRYEGDPSKPLVALVGKGVTFDTGGISLKSGRDLSDMRMDMGGAAAVAGAMQLLAASQAKVNVVALIQIVENMPDSKALLPGEVIQYKNGHTVQVGNTDAEGRLILADGLIRAGELNADYIVNIATLTGAIAAALGSKIGGVFGDEQLAEEMKHLGQKNGDFIWPMPLVEAYDSYLSSDYADFSNISNKGEAGAITAALFLRKFVPESAKWLHVDMAGMMEGTENGYYTKSATGFGARLLADYTEHVSTKSNN